MSNYYIVEELLDIEIREIEPYLEKYFFDRIEQDNEFRWDKIKDKS